MGARGWHVARADHHKRVADFLQEEHPDWAAVALFYSAMMYIHSSLADESRLVKDERHPRKHTAKAGSEHGGRGTNQLVRDLYPNVHTQYISLFEMSRRTRYDIAQLGGEFAYKMLLRQWADIKKHCVGLNETRAIISSQQS
ncbi:hypothetical protein SAMN05444157_0211 [Frankineae bacterium MT45]|nr:hypothetical protein SAMN05444157_0211 [Frankineae bacterium MT45]